MALLRQTFTWFFRRFGGFELAADTTGPAFESLLRQHRIFPNGITSLLNPSAIVWHAVPKRRRSLEKRKTRRFFYKFFENAKPKTNLVSCSECGNWHEKQYICPHCYSRVRMETEKAKEAFGVDRYQYNWPASDVQLAYKGENELVDRLKREGKFVVQVDRPRPNWWFGKNLLSKSTKS